MSEPTGVKPIPMPVSAQITVVNAMVLPLLKRSGIDVTVNPTKEGMTLSLVFNEPPDFDPDQLGTDEPDNARELWALREKIEQYKADRCP